MRPFSLLLAATAIVSFAGFTQTSSPAHACAGSTDGATGLTASPAFGDSGKNSFSLGGEGDTTPRFGFNGFIGIAPDEANDNADGDAPLADLSGGGTLITLDCPD